MATLGAGQVLRRGDLHQGGIATVRPTEVAARLLQEGAGLCHLVVVHPEPEVGLLLLEEGHHRRVHKRVHHEDRLRPAVSHQEIVRNLLVLLPPLLLQNADKAHIRVPQAPDRKALKVASVQGALLRVLLAPAKTNASGWTSKFKQRTKEDRQIPI